MIEVEELNRFLCVDSDGLSTVVVKCQFFEVVETERGIRRRPGAIFLNLENGEEVGQIDATCFEVISSGKLLTIDTELGDYEADAREAVQIPLCRYEEQAEQENRSRQNKKAKPE